MLYRFASSFSSGVCWHDVKKTERAATIESKEATGATKNLITFTLVNGTRDSPTIAIEFRKTPLIHSCVILDDVPCRFV